MSSEKLIVALDVPTFDEAKSLVNQLGNEVGFYKIGLELMMSGQYFEIIKFLKENNKKVFCDLKFHDIPTTVARAVENIAKYDVDLLTIHAISEDICQAVKEAKKKCHNLKVVGVTVLTTYDDNLFNKTLASSGYEKNTIENLVLGRAAIALENGLDGVVASAMEAKKLREKFGQKFGDFVIVTPGIRLDNSIENDDQKRAVDVKTALENGSSYLVVGRPITRAENPLAAAQKFNELIEKYS